MLEPTNEMRRLLFICTGNYYRSRFAEGLFNHWAEDRALCWRAYSRGLNVNWIIDNTDLSPFTHEALARRGIELRHTGERRMPLSRQDLSGADCVVALKRSEHYPMMEHQFPGWQDRIVYWEVHDVDLAEPDDALREIEGLVGKLIDTLTDG